MKVLVTGSSGFLGGNFKKKYESEFEIIDYNKTDGDDILDLENLLKKTKNVHAVVHLAAIPGPEDEPYEKFFQTNVIGTLNVCKAAAENKVKRVILASSTTVYGVEEGINFPTPLTEKSLFLSQYLDPDSHNAREAVFSYSTSKVMAEQIMAWHGFTRKFEAVVLRFGPIGKEFLGVKISTQNAIDAISLALKSREKMQFEVFNVVDDGMKVKNEKIKRELGFDSK